MMIGLPSGIGDVSWAYSKLKNAGRFAYEIADGWPPRTVDFMELLPEVESVAFGPFKYDDIVAFEQGSKIGHHPKWSDIGGKYSSLLLEPNRHLEMGKRLEDWLPDLPTDFHYEIRVREEDKARARNKLSGHPKPWTGISAASYRGSEAWKTWGYDSWSPFLKAWHAEVGGTIFLLGGFWDDLTDTLSDDGWPSLVGRTSVGTVVDILERLDFYLGFSSGLGVIRTVLNKNAFTLWPDHQVELSTSWVPPEMMEDGRYAAVLWRDVDLVRKQARNWLRRLSV